MLSFLQRLAAACRNLLQRAVGLILPFFSQPRDFHDLGRGLRWTLATLLLVGILLVLGWVNVHFRLGAWLRSAPTVHGIFLGDLWLPILALLVYLLFWLGWWLWRLLEPEQEISDFPDLDQAWEESLNALHRAGIDLREPPLFLVLGEPVGSEKVLFEEANLQLRVFHAPDRPTAPLHLYANAEGVYVTCAGASLLGRQAAILSPEGDPHPSPVEDGVRGGLADDIHATVIPSDDRMRAIREFVVRIERQGRSLQQLTPEEQRELQRLRAQEEMQHARQTARPRPMLLRNAGETARLASRLKHLCRLIVRDRQPYCPVNGILLLVPFGATDTNEDALQTGLICQQDLAAARQALRVRCPLFALVCDLERAEGFREFLEHVPAEDRRRRVGQRFPLVPDLPEKETSLDWVSESVRWIGTVVFPSWIYKLFRVETPGRNEFAAVVRANVQLYWLLSEVRERGQRLSTLLQRALAVDKGQPWLFGGCYLAGTGRDVAREQAFVPGVFRRLIEEQNYVSWTDDAVREEERYERWVRYCQWAIAGGILALLASLYYAVSSFAAK